MLDDGEVLEPVCHVARHAERPPVGERPVLVRYREAVNRQPALRAGVAFGGERRQDRPVGRLTLGGVHQVVAVLVVEDGRALARGLLEPVDVLGVGQARCQALGGDVGSKLILVKSQVGRTARARVVERVELGLEPLLREGRRGEAMYAAPTSTTATLDFFKIFKNYSLSDASLAVSTGSNHPY